MSQQYLVVDNGSYNIKAGFSTNNGDQQSPPLKIQNAITKTRDGQIYVGNDHLSHTNNYSGINFKRPHEQGHLTSWETQKPVWDYTLDKLSPHRELDLSSIHLTLTETAFTLPQLSINTDQIVFEEYGFNEYYRCTPASLVPWSQKSTPPNDFTLVIDAGAQATWITPVVYQKVLWKAAKKLPVGGKTLNGLLRDVISFRHYDITDEPLLVNTIKEQTCFVAQDFNTQLKQRLQSRCEFVLPDFKTTLTGYVKHPNHTATNAKTKISSKPEVDDHDSEQSLQLVDERFSVPECFFQPELLFDNNITTAQSPVLQSAKLRSVVDMCVEAIFACPEVTRPLLAGNIRFVGGTCALPGFRTRLLKELKKELPVSWIVKEQESSSEVPLDEVSWYGGVNLTNDDVIDKLSVSKKEYFEHGSNWCQKQFGFENI